MTRTATRTVLAAALALGLAATLALAFAAFAASPSSGEVSSDSTSASWEGGPFTVSNPAGCTSGSDPGCDAFELTVVPSSDGVYAVEIAIEPSSELDDFDLFVLGPDGSEVASSATASGFESVTLHSPPAGTYTVLVQAFLVPPGATYRGSATFDDSVQPQKDEPFPQWEVTTHGECCEGNLASSGDTTYVLLPILLNGNDILRSFDGGAAWEKVYPPVDLSVPFGIEGDLRAFGDDVVYFGTELTHGVAARSEDRGSNWTVVQVPVAFAANDQAWQYMGPLPDVCPVQTVPYVLTGWYRIGSVALFSCDGGLTWPIQTPLAGANGDGPQHVVCEALAHEPSDQGDTRVPNADFAKMKAGRHGGWGTDGRFYWSQASGGNLFVCQTDDFGVTWEGVRHPLAPGTPDGHVVTALAFDDRGTLYVLHANHLYVSFDRGESFRFVHTLPRFGNDSSVADRAAGWFVADGGTVHLAIKEEAPDGQGNIWYLRGKHADTAHPGWKEEYVDTVDSVRLDFMQITVDGNGIPTIGYTTPPNFENGVTTASRTKPVK